MHGITQAAFAQYQGKLNPLPKCFAETVEDVAVAIRNGGALIAWLGGEPIASLRYAFRPGYVWVERVSVLPAYRGLGAASELMHAVESVALAFGCADLRLSTRLSLPSNVALYERIGYHIIEAHQAAPAADIQVEMEKHLETLRLELA